MLTGVFKELCKFCTGNCIEDAGVSPDIPDTGQGKMPGVYTRVAMVTGDQSVVENNKGLDNPGCKELTCLVIASMLSLQPATSNGTQFSDFLNCHSNIKISSGIELVDISPQGLR